MRTRLLWCGPVLVWGLAGDAAALKPSRDYAATPDHYGIVHEGVRFVTPDSLRLAGWFFPAQDTAGIALDLLGRVFPVPEELRAAPRPYPRATGIRLPTIVICDGDAGNMADLIFYAHHFFVRGFNVFTFDWRGFGTSADWPLEPDLLCVPEFLTDYEAALEYVCGRPDVDASRVGLMGFSTGAYLSFAMLAKHPEIRAFTGRALLTSFEDLLPILHRLDPARDFRAPAGYPPTLLPVNAAPRVKAPVLLVVGERDPRTPPWMSERVLARLPGPKELWVVPGAGHGGPSGPEFANYPEFFERVIEFFEEHLTGP